MHASAATITRGTRRAPAGRLMRTLSRGLTDAATAASGRRALGATSILGGAKQLTVSRHHHRAPSLSYGPGRALLHYEALLRDPAREIRSIASFLGLDADDSDFINRVVEGSSFSRMRNAAVAAEDATENAIQDAKARPAYDVPGKLRQNERRLADHLRKGEIGDWRRHFDPYPGLLAAFEEAFADSCMSTCNGREWDCGEGQLMVTQRE